MKPVACDCTVLLTVVLLHMTDSNKASFEYSGPNYEVVSTAIPSANSHAGPLRVHLVAFNKTRILLLERSSYLVPSSRFVAEYRGADGSTVRTWTVDRNCYYSGVVDGEATSKVAVSTCLGLSGFVRTETEELILRPRDGVSLRRSTGQTLFEHVVYRTFHQPKKNEEAEGRSLNRNANAEDDHSSTPDAPSQSLPGLNQLRGSTASAVFIEILLVADKSMLQRYGSDKLPVYALATMNEAATLFHSQSLSVDVQLIVTHLVILEGDQRDLRSSRRAGRMLANFCSWKNNNSADFPSHDVAVFLTRNDICFDRDPTCNTRGLSFTGGMCVPDQASTINQDDGLHLAYTVAHEIGHTLGMLHDEDVGCRYGKGKRKLMTSSLSVTDGTMDWSPCSDRALLAFVRSDRAMCLYNVPGRVTSSYKQSFQALKEMCEQIVGHDVQVCYPQTIGVDAACSGVWCKASAADPCVLIQGAKLDGVTCGAQRICMNNNCVVGGWRGWSSYSLCSTTCGQGLRYRERHCVGDNHGCDGSSRQYQICQTQPCPLGSEDVRTSQCASFNDKQFKDGNYYNWIPHLTEDPGMECQLTCKRDNSIYFELLAPSVSDGTVCTSKHSGVCAGGKCKTVGCDGVVESKALRDKCGVCGGNGTSCSAVSATFQRHGLTYGYHEVVHLPVGSVRVNVTEIRVSSNYLVVRNGLDSSRYYVNGNWKISQPGIYSAAGATIFYRRVPESFETMLINGPLKEPLVIMVLVQNSNAHISYRYRVENSSSVVQSVTNKRYMWRFTTWTNCSQHCAGGAQTRQLVCHDTKAVKDVQQKHCYPTPNSVQLSRPCNMKPCPPRWSVGPWIPQHCPVTCEPGGSRKRDVHCVIQVSSTTTKLVRNRLCYRKNKPLTRKNCSSHDCPLGIWFEGQWNPCSVRCGEGQQTREILCTTRHNYSVLPFRDCNPSSQPVRSRLCTMPPCAGAPACRDIVTVCKLARTSNMCKRQSYYQRLCCHSCKKSFSSGST